MVLLLNAALKNNDAAKTMLRSMPDQHDFSSTVVKMLKVNKQKQFKKEEVLIRKL